MKRLASAWWAYLAGTVVVATVAGCHLVAGFDDLEPAGGGGGVGGSTASGTGGSTSSGGGTGGTTTSGGGGGGGSVPLYTVGGTVDGLDGELTLNNGHEQHTVASNGPFAFPTPLPNGTTYDLELVEWPPYQGCGFTNGSGQIAGENVTDIAIDCVSNNADLSALAVTCGTLSPGFNDATSDYAVATSVLTSTVEVTPTSLDPSSEIRVDNVQVPTGTPSAPISLGVGTTTIVIDVFSPGTATRTYHLDVTRQAALDAMPTYVKASNPDVGDHFGQSVAMATNTVVVGAPGESSSATGVNGNEGDDSANGSGAAYVLVQNGCAWTQEAYLKASNTGANDGFGSAVAISGDTIVVGAPAEDSDATGVGGPETNNNAFNSGAAYVFVRSGTTWVQQAYLKASNTDGSDRFGTSVALWSNTIVVGAPQEDSSATGVNGNEGSNGASNSGAAYVFVRNGTTWTQQAYLKASNPDANDHFGHAVAVTGDVVVVGAHHEGSAATGFNGNQSDNSAADAGAAYIFQRQGTAWSQDRYVKAINAQAGDQFGAALAAFQDTIVIGAPLEDSAATGVGGTHSDNGAADAGAAYVLVHGGSAWTQQAYVKASNTNAGDQFGGAVALFEDALVVGAAHEASDATGTGGNPLDNSAALSGAAYVFTRASNSWTALDYLKASNSEPDDTFGVAVAIGDGAVFVGAELEDSNSPGIGGDGSNNAATDAGAAYLFQ